MNDNNLFIDKYLETCKSRASTITPLIIINLILQYMNNFIYVEDLQKKKLKYNSKPIWNNNNNNPFAQQSVSINGIALKYLFIIYGIQSQRKKHLRLAIQFPPLLWNAFSSFEKLEVDFKLDVIVNQKKKNNKKLKLFKFKKNEIRNGNNLLFISGNIPQHALNEMFIIKFQIFSVKAYRGIFYKIFTKKETPRLC